MIAYKIDDKKLIIDTKEIVFCFGISKVEEADGYLIVLLKNVDSGDVTKQPVDNIYAVGKNAKILWNIKDIVGENPFYGGFYIETSLSGSQYLVAVACMGKRHTIDLSNKILSNVECHRF